MRTAGVLAAVAIGVVAVFQIGLAAGAPAGSASWGGAHPGVLPTRLRLASGIAGLVVYPALTLYVLAASGVIETSLLEEGRRLGIWVLTGLFALATAMNLISRSRIERLWAPVAALIAVCCAIIASGI